MKNPMDSDVLCQAYATLIGLGHRATEVQTHIRRLYADLAKMSTQDKLAWRSREGETCKAEFSMSEFVRADHRLAPGRATPCGREIRAAGIEHYDSTLRRWVIEDARPISWEETQECLDLISDEIVRISRAKMKAIAS
jgi:hypothetical protein